VFSFDEFFVMLNSLEKGVTEKFALKLYKKQMDRQAKQSSNKDQDALSMDTLVELLTQYKIGGYGHYIFG